MVAWKNMSTLTKADAKLYTKKYGLVVVERPEVDEAVGEEGVAGIIFFTLDQRMKKVNKNFW